MKRICREAKHVTTARPPPMWSSIFTNTSKPRTPRPHLPSPRTRPDSQGLRPVWWAEGEWRDYAIDHLTGPGRFFGVQARREVPLYRIEKNPKLAAKQGAFSVLNAHGRY
ncbi:DUF2794 domain-containing protein [Sinorhizobium meliloti]|nr:DUF2794 domain-containing protein [Sinorhizobium meliloti]